MGNIRLQDLSLSARCLIVFFLTFGCLIDAALLIELISMFSSGTVIRPAICALLITAAIPLMAEVFCMHAPRFPVGDTSNSARKDSLEGLPIDSLRDSANIATL
jgi:hypothetical protein